MCCSQAGEAREEGAVRGDHTHGPGRAVRPVLIICRGRARGRDTAVLKNPSTDGEASPLQLISKFLFVELVAVVVSSFPRRSSLVVVAAVFTSYKNQPLCWLCSHTSHEALLVCSELFLSKCLKENFQSFFQSVSFKVCSELSGCDSNIMETKANPDSFLLTLFQGVPTNTSIILIVTFTLSFLRPMHI